MSDQALSTPAPRLPSIPGVAIMLVALSVGFALASPGFLTGGNISNILVQSVLLLLLALPMTLIIMTEGLDLSMGAVLTLASLVLAIILVTTKSLMLGLAGAVAVGVAFGLLNGWLVSVLAIPPFVATLGTMGAAQGLALIVSDGQSVVGIPRYVRQVYSGDVMGIPTPVLIGAGFYALFHVLLYHTRFGTYICALGGNRDALTLAGVKWRRLLIAVYALGGAMAGVAALLMTARMNAGHPTAAIGMEFDAIAAVALGGTSFEKGNGWIFGTLMGVVTVGILRNGLNLMAVPSSVQVACIGGLVIFALFLDSIRGHKS
ncbi:MAG: ABC transporter permease [Azorhizobium sp. 39-67-5]|nr:MAG: ABC transporter permease [Rhizobiales bacterium 12-68-15]OYX90509.1 MAG: ABC transporter permease [Azorhizobium sp. 32-67-21]OYY13870.1 MAG: ABC transporter permease [Rhizobiales bacterium 35-68-8]OZA91420.1 MAG: ABC transporter permease [Azorhizobium sp. 39-67-5]